MLLGSINFENFSNAIFKKYIDWSKSIRALNHRRDTIDVPDKGIPREVISDNGQISSQTGKNLSGNPVELILFQLLLTVICITFHISISYLMEVF